jgi:fatty acid desaturase
MTEMTLIGFEEIAEAEVSLSGSPDLRKIVHPSNGTWVSFRSRLRPRYWLVARDLAFCMAMIVGGFAASLWVVAMWGNRIGFEAGMFFAIWIGFWLNAVMSFGHEAAHYNLAANRNVNDALADWTVWLFFAEDTKAYRKSHWQHHLHLGEDQDTEISYRNCLSPWFIAKTLTGIYLIALVVRYAVHNGFAAQTRAAGTDLSAKADVSHAPAQRRLLPIIRSLLTHALFIGVALGLHCYASAVIWAVAVAFVFPSFASIRQILEHRSAEIACSNESGQLAVNRMFGTDPFSRYFGAAGFNRHLLHHWDPTISYTRFDEMLDYLRGTSLAEPARIATTNYFSSLCMLLKKANHGS